MLWYVVFVPLSMRGVVQSFLARKMFSHRSSAQTHTPLYSTKAAAQYEWLLHVVLLRNLLPVISTATSKAFYCSRSPAEKLEPLEAMAAIIVQDEYVKVNTTEVDRAGVLDAAKVLLASATVHSDYLSFGPSTEQRMLEEAYQGVTTQCAAQIALASSEAKVPNLIEMCYVGDEGLAKLKPTARLSPKRETVRIFVSDSSTALCKSNRKGKLTKGGLAQEIDNVISTELWLSPRVLHYVLGKNIELVGMAGRRAFEDCCGGLCQRYGGHHRLVGRQRDQRSTGLYPDTHMPGGSVQGCPGIY